MAYEPIADRPKTAKEYWDNPPISAGERLRNRRNPPFKVDHSSMMDFAELYADYICDYEKTFDRLRQK